jgi:hypothetical protein
MWYEVGIKSGGAGVEGEYADEVVVGPADGEGAIPLVVPEAGAGAIDFEARAGQHEAVGDDLEVLAVLGHLLEHLLADLMCSLLGLEQLVVRLLLEQSPHHILGDTPDDFLDLPELPLAFGSLGSFHFL